MLTQEEVMQRIAAAQQTVDAVHARYGWGPAPNVNPYGQGMPGGGGGAPTAPPQQAPPQDYGDSGGGGGGEWGNGAGQPHYPNDGDPHVYHGRY